MFGEAQSPFNRPPKHQPLPWWAQRGGFGVGAAGHGFPPQQPGPPGDHTNDRTGGPPKAPGSTPVDSGLTSDQTNAYTVILGVLQAYGLQSLAPVVLGYVRQGYTADAINVLIQQTPEWKARFAGNEIRLKNGLAPLDPATYLATEAGYAQAIRQAGLPAGFYDGGDNFASWIGGDVSVAEVQQRAQDASALVDSQDPALLQAFSSYYGIDKGHLAAYFLDQDKALPILQRQVDAANIGAAAIRNNLGLGQADAERYASMGVTASQANAAYQQIADALPAATALANIYHQAYGQKDLEAELLGGSGSAQLARESLVRKEQGQFSGQGAAGSTLQDPGYGVAVSTSGKF